MLLTFVDEHTTYTSRMCVCALPYFRSEFGGCLRHARVLNVSRVQYKITYLGRPLTHDRDDFH